MLAAHCLLVLAAVPGPQIDLPTATPPSEVLLTQNPGELFNELVVDGDVAYFGVAASLADARVEAYDLQSGAKLAEYLPNLPCSKERLIFGLDVAVRGDLVAVASGRDRFDDGACPTQLIEWVVSLYDRASGNHLLNLLQTAPPFSFESVERVSVEFTDVGVLVLSSQELSQFDTATGALLNTITPDQFNVFDFPPQSRAIAADGDRFAFRHPFPASLGGTFPSNVRASVRSAADFSVLSFYDVEDVNDLNSVSTFAGLDLSGSYLLTASRLSFFGFNDTATDAWVDVVDASTGALLHVLENNGEGPLLFDTFNGFGEDLQVQGDLAVVGEPVNSNLPTGQGRRGAVYVYDLQTGEPLRRYLQQGSPTSEDRELGPEVAWWGSKVLAVSESREPGGAVAVAPDLQVLRPDAELWSDAGGGIPRDGIIPELQAGGGNATGGRLIFEVPDVDPLAFPIVVFGGSASPVPFGGGTLVPTVEAFFFDAFFETANPFVVNPANQTTHLFWTPTAPETLLPGQAWWVQIGLVDGLGIYGSNAVVLNG